MSKNTFGLAARLLFALALTVMVSACADSVSAPVVLQGLPPEQKATLHISDVSAEAAPGVAMTKVDLDRITARVKLEFVAGLPGTLADPNTPPIPGSAKIKLVFTQYDAGNAFARFMLAGLGQIHIDANVIFLDDSGGAVLAQYQISKDFAFGGIVGATTKIENVEEGFAKSVVAILKEKKV